MKLARLILKNVRCYQHLDLSFTEEDDDGAAFLRNRTVILGNNGTGKSTILKSIALVLAGSSALGEIIGNPDSWVRRKTQSCTLEAHLETAAEESRTVTLTIQRGDNLSKIMSRNADSLQALDAALQHTERNYLTIGYGVHRNIGGSALKSGTSSFQNSRAENVATLFDAEATLYPFEAWIMDLDYRKGAKGMKSIKKALDKLMPEVKFHGIDKEARSVRFKGDDGIVDFGELSDGFQITANWMGDLLFRITNTYEDHADPLAARFILLIDEIALHLHPAWQRVILQSISELLPHAQIIVTTHSPFVAQQAGNNELFTVIRNTKNVLDLFHYQNDPRKLLIHQIIMSDIFGIATDESVAVEKAKDEVRKNPLLADEALNRSASRSIGGLASEHLRSLKGVDSLREIPLNKYSHESMDYNGLLNKLQDEIKKISDEKS